MFHCKFSQCEHVSETVVQFIQHTKLHSNTPNYRYQCGISQCTRMYNKDSVLKAHMYRDHKGSGPSLSKQFDAPLKCVAQSCEIVCNSLTSLIKHLKSHIREGLKIKCPFRECSSTFTVESSLAAHISRKHKHVEDLDDSMSTGSAPTEQFCISNQPCLETPDEDRFECEEPFAVDESLFLQNITLLYLKLQSKLLLPASTITTIIEDFQNAHEIGLSHALKILSEKLKALEISEAIVSNIIEEMRRDDLLRFYNRELLNTNQKRKSVFKSHFDYVEPVPLFLGNDENGKERFAQYIPIKETLAALFKTTSVREQHAYTHSQPPTPGDVLRDVKDGEGFKSNSLMKTASDSLGLILYQDAFEVVNPLGSGKKKHKVLAVYCTLTDILPHNRSTTDHMQLVLLCRENDFKYFGINKVFEPLIKDLKFLEETGISMPSGKIVKGTLVAISGDNLGSHCIGGFLENFSRADYFCRYCEINKTTFVNEPNLCGTARTVQSYKSHVQDLDTAVAGSVFGIKGDSPFNKLAHFHVCQPGLPPCLGHDLFEGVVSYDLALFVGRLVEEEHFTYLQLNRCKNQFKYKGNDANDKPGELSPGSERLSGHAVQNWCFLRILPLLIGDRIKDPCRNEVWQLILQLREIVELVCAPAVTTGQVAYLKVLIEEYICTRQKLFPDNPLRPKHHYMCHYPDLIHHFGPLIRLWTLRFESKHSYFKKCARKLHNFKNLCKTLAERHQLLQAYLGAGSMFPPVVQIQKGVEFYIDDYSDRIREAVASYNFDSQSTVACNEITVKGTLYRKGMFVLLEKHDDELYAGRIILVVVVHESVYFVAEKHTFAKLRDIGVYCELGVAQDDYLCVNQEHLLDYYPLPTYEVFDLLLIALHHAFPEVY